MGVEWVWMKFVFYLVVEWMGFVMGKRFWGLIWGLESEKEMEEGCGGGVGLGVGVKVGGGGFGWEGVWVGSIGLDELEE